MQTVSGCIGPEPVHYKAPPTALLLESGTLLGMAMGELGAQSPIGSPLELRASRARCCKFPSNRWLTRSCGSRRRPRLPSTWPRR